MANQKITGDEVKRGMIVKIYGDTKVAVDNVRVDGVWGGIILTDLSGRTFGIDKGETGIEVIGQFNPDD